MNQGKFREGVAHFAEAVRIRQGPETYFNLGLAYLQSGEPENAVKNFSESLRLKPDSPSRQYHLALALAAQKDRSSTIASAKKARELALATGQNDIVAKANALLDEQALGKSETPTPSLH